MLADCAHKHHAFYAKVQVADFSVRISPNVPKSSGVPGQHGSHKQADKIDIHATASFPRNTSL